MNVPASLDVTWQQGTSGFVRYGRDLTIIAASNPEIIGAAWDDIDGVADVYAADIEHAMRHPRETRTVRRLWHGRIWESTFRTINGEIVVAWTCLYVIPADAGESMSRWLSVGRLVLACLEGDDQAALAEQAAPATPRSAAVRRLQVV